MKNAMSAAQQSRPPLQPKKMTLNEAVEILKGAGIDDALSEARLIFKSLGGAKDVELIDRSFEVSSDAVNRAIKRRAKREPLQYILGRVDFYRESYLVTPDCLIPRQDTEILVDFAVKSIPAGARFADVCCGSGCIGISVLKNTENTEAVAIDISAAALGVAKQNAEENGVIDRIRFIHADALTSAPEGEFFAILSNPPYVTNEAYKSLEPEIYREPVIAFVGGEDGADFYRALTPMYRSKIPSNGFLAYEIGYDQEKIIQDIAKENAMSCEIIFDYSENPRVAVLKPL